MTADQAPARGPDPAALLRSPAYVRLLLLAAALGLPLSALAYGFLALTSALQEVVYQDLAPALGFATTPDWWAVPMLAIGGLLTGAAIRWLPGRGGHVPADGLKTSGPPVTARELPGVFLAAVASLTLGAVIGPEAPLIALGGGLAVTTLNLIRKDSPPATLSVVSASGSFAAISALLGSPLLGAFLLMEASGLGGATLGLVLVPGLLSAGIGALVFVGLDNWTGLGTYSLAVPDLSGQAHPTLAQLGWAVVIGLAAVAVGLPVRRGARALEPLGRRHTMTATPAIGILVGLIAWAFVALTDQGLDLILFSGEESIGPLLANPQNYSVGVLVILVIAKSLAYLLSLSVFRGGPVFPAIFIGTAGGLLLSHLPGLEPVAAAAMGIAAMSTVMLGLPLTSVLLATLLLPTEGLQVMPMAIVSVVVAYVAAARFTPAPPGTISDRPGPPGAGAPPVPR